MAFTTFSGPVRAGTVKEGATRNAGLVELIQTYTIPTSAILTAPAALTAFYVPAGTKILSVGVEVVEALATATNCGLTVGKLGGTANFFVTTFNTGATVGRVAQATVDTATVVTNTDNVGTADVGITVTPTAATGNATTGRIVVTLRYMQRAVDGTSNPVSSL